MSSRHGIDAGVPAVRVDGREGFGEARADGFAAIEKRAAPGGDLGEHAARHDIARRQLAARIDGQHEALAAAVDQRRAFAAQRFGRERRGIDADVDGGRMELHELGVGDHGAGARRHGDRFAARIGGLVVTA